MSMPAASSHADPLPLQEMNITPLIDVMLVLLVMFIITIPMQTHAVKVDVARGDTRTFAPDPVRNRITIDPAGVIRWNGAAMDRLTLRRTLDRMVRMPMQPTLELEPHAQARYVTVDSVLSDIKRSGAKNMGFVGNEHYARF
ncbi:MAG TPA: biopolymer transporter ExbD [Sphingobium sp.]